MKLTKLIVITLAVLTLSACNFKQTVEVNLTDEERSEIKADIDEYKVQIDEWTGEDGSFPYIASINLARSYADLGEIGMAIKLYEDLIDSGAINSAVFNNLGRLYENIEEYDKAIIVYKRIVDELFNENYLYDITWAYIRAGDRKNAEKYFNAWQLEMNKTDEQTQQKIKELRESEMTT